jgi:hypothetical protein
MKKMSESIRVADKNDHDHVSSSTSNLAHKIPKKSKASIYPQHHPLLLTTATQSLKEHLDHQKVNK